MDLIGIIRILTIYRNAYIILNCVYFVYNAIILDVTEQVL